MGDIFDCKNSESIDSLVEARNKFNTAVAKLIEDFERKYFGVSIDSIDISRAVSMGSIDNIYIHSNVSLK